MKQQQLYYEEYWDSGLGGWSPRNMQMGPLERMLIDRYVHPDSRVLDYGCGDCSRCGSYVESRGAEYIGLDISLAAIRECKRQGKNALIHDSNSPIPFPSNWFDVVLCIEVLEHLFHPDIVLKEIIRILMPGGVIVASVPNTVWLGNRLFMLAGFFIEFRFAKRTVTPETILHSERGGQYQMMAPQTPGLCLPHLPEGPVLAALCTTRRTSSAAGFTAARWYCIVNTKIDNPGGSPATSLRAPWKDPHIRFFSKRSLLKLLSQELHLGILEFTGTEFSIADLPPLYKISAIRGFLDWVSFPVKSLGRHWPSLFASHLFVVARKSDKVAV